MAVTETPPIAPLPPAVPPLPDIADFTAEEEGAPLPPPAIGPEIARIRETARARLSAALVGLLFVLNVMLLGLAAWKVRPFDKELFALLLTGMLNPVVALVGMVLGFYFGEKAAKGN